MSELDKLLQHDDLSAQLDGFDLQINPKIHGVSENDRGLFFRAHLPNSILNSSEHNGRNSVYGTGIYAGNSVESIELFTWSNPFVISAYLTPPLADEQILDLTRKSALLELGRAAFSGYRHGETSSAKHLLEIRQMGFDTRVATRLQTRRRGGYPISPVWYVWKGPENDLQEVARITPNFRRRTIFDLLHGTMNKRSKEA